MCYNKLMPWSVIIYPPVTKFIQKLPREVSKKVVSHIELLEKYGSDLRPSVSKKITGRLFELRLVGQDSVRLLCPFRKSGFYILSAFRKKTQKTPGKEIKLPPNKSFNIGVSW